MKAAALRVVLVTVLAAGLGLQALADHTHVPNSTWKLNVAASDFGKGPAMKSDEYSITTDTEQQLVFTETLVDGDGKTWKTSWAGPQDGTDHPVKGMPGGKYASKTADDTGRMSLPDGTVMNQKFTFDGPKKKITVKIDGKTKDGKTFQQTLVYDRVK